MILTIRGHLFKRWRALDTMSFRVVAGVLEAKHGWLQSHYASREPLRCQSLSLQSMVSQYKCTSYIAIVHDNSVMLLYMQCSRAAGSVGGC